MKRMTLLGLGVGAIAISAAVYEAIDSGQKSPIMAAGKVSLKEDMVKDAVGIRTLFLVLYDLDSPMPMPFGAVKETLDKDVTPGDFYDFMITKEKIQMMNPQAPQPQRFRLKVRLDRDGMGGQDQPGDLVGQVTDIAFGKSDVRVEINDVVR